MTSVGSLAILSAVVGIIAFHVGFSEHPERTQTGPVIRFLSKHIWVVLQSSLDWGQFLRSSAWS